MPGMPRTATKSGARSTLRPGAGGKLRSARAKIGGECSEAMSAFSRKQFSPAIFAVLGKCRAKARALKQGMLHRAAGNDLKAQHLEHRVNSGGPVTKADRAARLKERLAERSARRAASAPAAAPSRPPPPAPAKAARVPGIVHGMRDPVLAGTSTAAEASRAMLAEHRELHPRPGASEPAPAPRVFKLRSRGTPLRKAHAYAVEEGHKAARRANARAFKSDAEIAVDRSHVERARRSVEGIRKAMRARGEQPPKVAPVAVEGKVVGGKAKAATSNLKELAAAHRATKGTPAERLTALRKKAGVTASHHRFYEGQEQRFQGQIRADHSFGASDDRLASHMRMRRHQRQAARAERRLSAPAPAPAPGRRLKVALGRGHDTAARTAALMPKLKARAEAIANRKDALGRPVSGMPALANAAHLARAKARLGRVEAIARGEAPKPPAGTERAAEAVRRREEADKAARRAKRAGRGGEPAAVAEHAPAATPPRPPGASRPRVRTNSDLPEHQRAAVVEQIRRKNPFIEDMARSRAHGVVQRARARLAASAPKPPAPAAPEPSASPAPAASVARRPASGRDTEDRLNRAAALRVDRALGRSPGARENFVKLAELRKRLAGPRERQDALIRRARLAGAHSLDSHEGLHGPKLTDAEKAASIHEAGSRLVYISRRDEPIAPARGTGRGKRGGSAASSPGPPAAPPPSPPAVASPAPRPSRSLTIRETQEPHPSSFRATTHEAERRELKARFVPRAPREGESVVRVGRPQTRSGAFAEYAPGDYLHHEGAVHVVAAAGKPGTRGGEGWKRWEQTLLLRPPTEAESRQIEAHRKRRSARGQAILDRMMDR